MFKHGHLIIPAFLVGLYLFLFFIVDGIIPGPKVLVEQLSSLYGSYGYEIVFISAILEATVVINMFFPGIFAIAFAAVFARSGQIDLSIAVILAAVGAMIGFLIDYTLGYFGFGRLIDKLGERGLLKKVKNHLHVSYFKTFGLGYFHPNVGSVVSLAAGALKIKVLNFIVLSTFSTIGWLSLWGILAFAMGDLFTTIVVEYFYVLVLLIFSVWVLILFHEYNRK